ncbi:MAG: hypothetical protein BHV98_06930 [Clostridium sp. CAG:217_53_7]|nr:MAG: hypothetical protein BHV98_06930 [Clostridium sp. CAG:217_53_7]
MAGQHPGRFSFLQIVVIEHIRFQHHQLRRLGGKHTLQQGVRFGQRLTGRGVHSGAIPLISPQYRRHKAGIQIAVAHAGNLYRVLRLRHKSIRIICRALPRQPISQ